MTNVTFTNADPQQASLLTISQLGYERALAAEPNGLFAAITSFRVASKSVPTFVQDNPYGDTVYTGPISDYEVLDPNVILFTLIIPPEVQAATIDSLALFLADGTMFAQGFLRGPRNKVADVACYIYAYLNAPEPLLNVEARLKTRATFPQVENYCDLPKAAEAIRTEYVVNNGHCGYVGVDDNPEFLPVIVVASSGPPKTPVYAPDAPATIVAFGSMVSGQYTYAITADNAGGETLPSPASTIHLVPLASTTAQAALSSGSLATGSYYYTVTAQTPGGGETLPSAEVSAAVTQLAIPDTPSTTLDVGGMQSGTYQYCVSALSDYGETTPSAVASVSVPDDSGVELTWPAVAGARGYRIYVLLQGAPVLPSLSSRAASRANLSKSRQRFSSFCLLFETDASTTVAYDWGNSINATIGPRSIRSDAGIQLSWEKVSGATSYCIYGRAIGPATKTKLATVPGSVLTWRDTGVVPSATLEPTANGTNSGVTLTWAPVEGADTYSVYGRQDGDFHLLATGLTDTTWTDDGSVPETGAAPPTLNATTEWEWQMVDGTIVYRGALEDATATTFSTTLQPTPTPVTTTNRLPDAWDLGFMAFTSGPMQGQARHIRHVADSSFEVMDRQFDEVPDDGTTITIWAGPGCCGGICGQQPNEEEVVFPQPPRPPILVAPDYSWLGVHFCGIFLGEAGLTAQQINDASFMWNNASAPDVVRNGVLDQLFCNERGVPAYDVPLDNQTMTPHGNRLPVGEYASTLSAVGNAVLFTMDSIAVAPGIRLVVFSQPNFTGDILLDVVGPFYICNWIWRADSRFSWALDAAVWHGLADQIIPSSRRFWSDRVRVQGTESYGLIHDLHLWRGGSIRVSQTW